ncbi:hypothetical protein [Pandoraea sp. XY-2]|uniref:hypothetical protein n=1 Tax=Pandoraea sp. XY-2 TaxID=2518599 RepID=UPI00101B1119|nr:hypothetical protein [Pandoraea sp. XY-2]QBC32249.1 hypothetical protein DRB87_14035 [Pandoraea sp. XY-2]
MELRRDVFLPAAEGAAAAIVVSAKMLNPETKQEEITAEGAKIVKAINALHVVASTETLENAIDLGTQIGTLLTRMEILRAKMLKRSADLKAVAGVVDREIQNGNALVEMMKANNLGNASLDQEKKIQGQWKLHQQMLTGWMEQRDQLHETLRGEALEAHAAWEAMITEMAPYQTRTLLALRKELGFPINENSYQRRLDEARETAKKLLDDSRNAAKQL